jgi:hypothetical protein
MAQVRLKWKLLVETETEHDTEEEALKRAYNLPRHHTALRVKGPHGELITAAEIRRWCSEHKGE